MTKQLKEHFSTEELELLQRNYSGFMEIVLKHITKANDDALYWKNKYHEAKKELNAIPKAYETK